MPSLALCIRASHAQERVGDRGWGHATPGSHKEGKPKVGSKKQRTVQNVETIPGDYRGQVSRETRVLGEKATWRLLEGSILTFW